MRIFKIIPSVFFLLFACTFISDAQTWEVGIHGGGAGYIGDLNQKNPVKISGMAAGGFVKRNINPYWAFGLHYTHGIISGDDANSSNEQFRNRNINFRSALDEVLARVDFNFLDYFSGGGTKKFSPYLFSGFGGVIFRPTGKYGGETYKLYQYMTEGQPNKYKNYTLTIPYGAGVKYRIKESVSLFAEVGYRTTQTDYLDDVSGKYPDPVVYAFRTGQPLSDPSLNRIGIPGTQRGDYRKRDTYMFMTVGLSFAFLGDECYKF
ncbi:MAG: hypothetical protein EOO88_22955 [Pedobacter sp.]|nr:MAG: hypothetical protein EOO88_22955 [Pedobacter sp.]